VRIFAQWFQNFGIWEKKINDNLNKIAKIRKKKAQKIIKNRHISMYGSNLSANKFFFV
jgi:hypothetical protein